MVLVFVERATHIKVMTTAALPVIEETVQLANINFLCFFRLNIKN